MEVAQEDLRVAVERAHGGIARLAQIVPITEVYRGHTVWEGI
jgi:hypothetical protein